MKPLNSIIIEKSYIIGKGLKKILEESGKFNIIDIVINSHQLEGLLSHHNIEIIFLNNNNTSEFIKILSHNNKINLIAITDDKNFKPINLYFDFINIHNERSKVILKIEEIFEKLNKNEKNETIELSNREKTILKYVALGYTTKQIAEELFLSPHTVVTHRKNISNRLGIKTVSGLTIYAVLNNIIDLSEAK